MNANWLVLSACVLVAMVATAGVGRADENADPTQASWAQAQPPWASKPKPGDMAKNHVEEVTDGQHAYVVVQGGTVDGRNCRTPLGFGMMREGAIEQTWESNRAVRMENVGDTDIVNPWLSNGRNNFRTLARDRRRRRQARHERCREGLRPLVPGDHVTAITKAVTTTNWATP